MANRLNLMIESYRIDRINQIDRINRIDWINQIARINKIDRINQIDQIYRLNRYSPDFFVCDRYNRMIPKN